MKFLKIISEVCNQSESQLNTLIRLPGDSLVHQALLQSVSQSLMYEGVTDKCSSFAQRGFQLQKHMVLHKL